MRKPISKTTRKQKQNSEVEEINLLNSWIESQKPDCGSNPMSLPPLPSNAPIGRLDPTSTSFSRYAGATSFAELPISRKTKDALRQAKFTEMTDIQRACLPHALCGRDILGAAKTGSGKTLAFVIPLLEKLYKERWNPEDGVGSIIISPTRELASQTFDVLRAVGKHHNFSAGLLIGGRKDVEAEKERINKLNILVCTPGRLLQHMDETPNFECLQLQVLILDEADRILDVGFKKTLNAIISQLPKKRQTFLFSATQTKSVQDLARLSLKDPEYLSVHEKATKATPNRLKQTAMIVPLDKKLDMLWSFIKAHLSSRILVFLSTRKQVKFVYEAFKKLRPGIPLKCLHGKMKQEGRMGTYSQFHEKATVLFSTDVASRGLDFNQAVDWVVQVDCPEDVASYIHRVGRTARYQSEGRSLLFVMPSETKMLEKLEAAKIPIESIKANNKRLQPVSGLLSALLVKYPDTLPGLAKRAFITYLKSIQNHKDKEVFDVMQLPVDEFSASMGLPMTPKIRFLNHKMKSKKPLELSPIVEPESSNMEDDAEAPREELNIGDSEDDEADAGLIQINDTPTERADEGRRLEDTIRPATRVLKKNKLKINEGRPTGTRKVFDDDGNPMNPLERVATPHDPSILEELQVKKEEYHKRLSEEVKKGDKDDKVKDRQRRREKRMKEKMKLRRANAEEEDDDVSDSEEEPSDNQPHKRSKIYFDSDDDGEREEKKDKAEIDSGRSYMESQQALALKLLASMHQD